MQWGGLDQLANQLVTTSQQATVLSLKVSTLGAGDLLAYRTYVAPAVIRKY